ncbi:hypothetical protein WA538_000914 [Blastocystis sp. DL]
MTFDPEKGFHIGTLLSCIFSTIGQSIFSCFLVPTLPSLIRFYFPDIAVSDIGYYSGYLLSAYFLGQIVGPIFWGWFADQHGRKRAMLIMILFNILCIFGLGLSKNYYVSLGIRLIHGLTDGTLGVSKTIIAEISNDRNISLGTSFIFVGLSVGRLLGPFLCSIFTDATFVNQLLQHLPFLKEIPFSIPFSLMASVYIVAFFFFLFWSAETLSPEEMETARRCENEMKRELSGILRKNPLEGYDSHEQLLLQYNKYSSYSSILKDRDVLCAVLLYGFHTLAQMAFDSLLPSVLVNERAKGGFELDSRVIGYIQMASCPLSFSPLLICPLWSKLTPYRKEMIVLNSIIFCLFVCYPFESLFNESGIILQFAVITFLYVAYCGIRAIVFNISIVIVSNVSYKEFRGTIMGLSQTIGGLGRFIVGVCWLGDERVLR